MDSQFFEMDLSYVIEAPKVNFKPISRRKSVWTKEKRKALFEAAGDEVCCYRCKTKLTSSTATLEHILALSMGGSNDDSNLTLCCKDCNTKKGKSESDFVLYKHFAAHCLERIGSPNGRKKIRQYQNMVAQVRARIEPYWMPVLLDILPIEHVPRTIPKTETNKVVSMASARVHSFTHHAFEKGFPCFN